MKILNIEVTELICDHDEEPGIVKYRLSIQGQVQLIRTQEIAQFNLNQINSTDMLHFVIQNEVRVLGSQAISLGQVLSEGLDREFNHWISFGAEKTGLVDASSEVMKVKIKGGITLAILSDEINIQDKDIINSIENESVGLKEKLFIIKAKGKENKKRRGRSLGSNKNEKFALIELKSGHNCKGQGSCEISVEANREDVEIEFSKCPYLMRIHNSEVKTKKISWIIEKIKLDLGYEYTKMMDEARKRELRQIYSPQKPLKQSSQGSQRSLRSWTTNYCKERIVSTPTSQIFDSIYFNPCLKFDEENIIEIAGVLDIYIENLSTTTPMVISNCILGLLSKISASKLKNLETSILNSIEHSQRLQLKIIRSTLKASMHESTNISQNFDTFIAKLHDSNSNLKNSIEKSRLKKDILIYDKLKYQAELFELENEREQIVKNFGDGNILNDIENLRKYYDELNKLESELEEKIIKGAQEFEKSMNVDTSLLQEHNKEKERLMEEIFYINKEIDCVELENYGLRNELMDYDIAVYSSKEFEIILADLIATSIDNSNCIDNIRKEFLKYRLQRDQLATDQYNLEASIENTSALNQNAQATIKSLISSYSSKASEIYKHLKSLTCLLSAIEAAYARKSLVSKLFKTTLSRQILNESTKDSLLSELSYLSDFTFSFNHQSLLQNRLSELLSSLISAKSLEIKTLTLALLDIKSQNKVYLPFEGDYIDEALANYLNFSDRLLRIPFIRDNHGRYSYGSKKIVLKLERGRLIVKSGGGYLFLEQFIEEVTAGELVKIERKSPKKFRRVDKEEFSELDNSVGEINRPETPILDDEEGLM